MATTLEIPDIASASDEEMQRRFPALDGRWSRQTLALLARFETSLLSLNDNWASVPQDWGCPVCARSKIDLVRLSSQGVLLCRLHWHHDHLRDRGEKILRRGVPMLETHAARSAQFSAVAVCKSIAERFFPRLICEDCNTADGKAKTELKGVVDPDFSFSPSEIGRFIITAPNRPHFVDPAKARLIWEAVADDVADRLAFMSLLAKRVADGGHRKEGSGYHPNETLTLLSNLGETQPSPPPSLFGLRQAFSERSTRDDAAGTSSKTKSRPKVRIPTLADLQTFNATQHPETFWWAGGENWCCAACDRSRFEMLRISNAGEWTAGAHRRAVHLHEDRAQAIHFRHGWYGAGPTYRDETTVYICKDCRQIITDTKKEGADLTDDCLTVADLRSVLTDVRPHQRPVFDKAKAAALAAESDFHVSGVSDLNQHRNLCWRLTSKHIQMRRAGYSEQKIFDCLWSEMDDHHLDASEYLALLTWRLGEAEAFAATYERYRWPRRRD